MKIADFGLARNVREADYYRKTTDVCIITNYIHFAIASLVSNEW